MKSITKSLAILLITIAGLLLPSGALAQFHPAGIVKSTTSIQVKMIDSGKVSIPSEFEIALYEHLIRELNEKSGFGVVYRDGDRNGQTSPDIIFMRATVTGFKEGSERERQVTTVKGATKITVLCQFTDSQGTVLLERDIEGKVLFFGNNLKATQDFAKKAAGAADDALFIYRKNPDHGGSTRQTAASTPSSMLEKIPVG